MIETKLTCPLGSQCEKVVGDTIERCMWYVTLTGKNPQTGEQMEDRSNCAMAWIPILQIDGTGRTDRVADAINRLETAVATTNPIQVFLKDEKLLENINGSQDFKN